MGSKIVEYVSLSFYKTLVLLVEKVIELPICPDFFLKKKPARGLRPRASDPVRVCW